EDGGGGDQADDVARGGDHPGGQVAAHGAQADVTAGAVGDHALSVEVAEGIDEDDAVARGQGVGHDQVLGVAESDTGGRGPGERAGDGGGGVEGGDGGVDLAGGAGCADGADGAQGEQVGADAGGVVEVVEDVAVRRAQVDVAGRPRAQGLEDDVVLLL